jgi:dGTPase
MISRQELEEREERTLAPYSAKAGKHRGRKYPEDEHPYRTAFQRDRDRVIHSAAFRRLEYKTQVFVNHEGDYYRTRLTHSMEAAQISRTIARAIALNEDLCEVLALGHDLGHTPFGHSGQDALHECMKDHGGFEHNLQGLRVVERLERRYAKFPGLNLTWDTRESMRKHTVHPHLPVEAEYEPSWAPLLETTVVDISDSIAYDAHDLDDGLKAGLITEAQVGKLELWREASARSGEDLKAMDPELRMRTVVRSIIDLEVTDLVSSSQDALKKLNIRGVEDVRKAPERPVRFSDAMGRRKGELQGFLRNEFYRHHRVVIMSEKAKRFITALFESYTTNPDQLPPRFREWGEKVGVHRSVADYIAGMTDRYAQDEYRRLFHPFETIL